jgi:DNA-binding NtrC family response regulator
MFICNPCLTKHYTNSESLSKSRGQCEKCNLVAVCNDIPSVYLERKDKPKPVVKAVPKPLKDVERDHILETLKYFNGHITNSARCLGVNRMTLYNKIKAYKIKIETDLSTGVNNVY